MERDEYIKGTQPQLSWVLLSAFRYSVGRHFTQALLGIQNIIKENFCLMCDDFIRQMIEDIEFERRVYELKKENKNKDNHFTDCDVRYLDSFYNELVKERERRENERAQSIYR